MTESDPWAELRSAKYAPLLALMCLGIWLNAADTLVTVTIMPSVARDIGGYEWFGWTSPWTCQSIMPQVAD